jgi:23S rRNA (guanine745-N1)-methyltransferase
VKARCVAILVCPVCRQSLRAVGRALKCPQSHSFDVAREGYVNLLLSRGRRAVIPGDSVPMVRARRRFLDRGHTTRLSSALNERAHHHLRQLAQGHSPTVVADIGCGEGYYLGRLKQYLDPRLERHDVCYFGMDVSKEAARLGARRYRGICFFVASVRRGILLQNGAVQLMLNVFAPRNPAEFGRVMAPGGLLMVVIPAPGHLAELRGDLNLLGIEPNKREHVKALLESDFVLEGEREIAYQVALTGEEVVDLVTMTPSFWHLSDRAWREVRTTGPAQAGLRFVLLEFRRKTAV